MDNIIKIMKALADENRLRIIILLTERTFCVRALSKRLNISEAAVSQHLKVLREAELVCGEKRGYFTHYHVKKETLSKVSFYLDGLSSSV